MGFLRYGGDLEMTSGDLGWTLLQISRFHPQVTFDDLDSDPL